MRRAASVALLTFAALLVAAATVFLVAAAAIFGCADVTT